MKIGIIGANGFVGKVMQRLFPDAILYDPTLNFKEGSTQEEINQCDIAFVTVSTLVIDENKLDVSIVEEVVAWCKCSLIIIRSTLNPGTADYLTEKYNKNICVVPEYVGETISHPLLDESKRPFIIIGGDPKSRRKTIELFQLVYNANISIRQVTNYEAEVIKLSENRAIAFKVAQCQELYDACELAGIDYYTVIQAVYGDDPRFDLWWTMVYPDKRGFNSKCLPKDVYAWCAWAESLGYKPEITRALLERNKQWISQ